MNLHNHASILCNQPLSRFFPLNVIKVLNMVFALEGFDWQASAYEVQSSRTSRLDPIRQLTINFSHYLGHFDFCPTTWKSGQALDARHFRRSSHLSSVDVGSIC